MFKVLPPALWTDSGSVQPLSHVQLFVIPWIAALPVHHHLPEFTQTQVYRVSDAIQPFQPLSSPSPPAPNPSQHQSFPMSQLFTWRVQSTGASALASFLSKKSQGWSPSEWIEWFKTQEFIITIRHFLQGLHAYLRNNNTTTNLGDSVKYILWKEWTHIFYYPVKASLLSILTKSN